MKKKAIETLEELYQARGMKETYNKSLDKTNLLLLELRDLNARIQEIESLLGSDETNRLRIKNLVYLASLSYSDDIEGLVLEAAQAIAAA